MGAHRGSSCRARAWPQRMLASAFSALQGCSPSHLMCCSMGCLPLQHPRDEWYAKAEETLGPDTITLVRKIRTLQVGGWA